MTPLSPESNATPQNLERPGCFRGLRDPYQDGVTKDSHRDRVTAQELAEVVAEVIAVVLEQAIVLGSVAAACPRDQCEGRPESMSMTDWQLGLK